MSRLCLERSRTARVTHLSGDDLYIRSDMKEKIKESTGSVPMEIGERRNSFRSRNKLDNMYLVLISVINS